MRTQKKKAKGKAREQKRKKKDTREFPLSKYSNPNSGRPRSPYSGLPHLTRPPVKDYNPRLLTQRVHKRIPNLRWHRLGKIVLAAIKAGAARKDARIVEFSIMNDHLHYVAEARSNKALASFMKGLGRRIGHAINKYLGTTGKVFADRYHRVDLVSLQQERNAIRYVLCNANKHRVPFQGDFDPLSSARWFPFWSRGTRAPESTSPTPAGTCWKLKTCFSDKRRIDPDYFGRA